jgi:tetratricopeptide (TPR) repeat protein
MKFVDCSSSDERSFDSSFDPDDLRSINAVENRRRLQIGLLLLATFFPVAFFLNPYIPAAFLLIAYALVARRDHWTAPEVQQALLKVSHLRYWSELGSLGALLKPHHSLQLKLDLSLSAAFDKALKALATVSNCRVTAQDMVNGRIEAHCQGIGYSDNIVIELEYTDVSATTLKVTNSRTRSLLAFGEDIGGSAILVARIRASLLDSDKLVPSKEETSALFKKDCRPPLLMKIQPALPLLMLFGLNLFVISQLHSGEEKAFWRFMYQKMPDQAVQAARAFKSIDHQRSHYLAGLAYTESGDFPKALEELDLAENLSFEPAALCEVHAARAVALARSVDMTGGTDLALAECNKASKILVQFGLSDSNTRAKVQYAYGLAYEAQGKTGEALQCFSESILLDEYAPAYRERAKILSSTPAASAPVENSTMAAMQQQDWDETQSVLDLQQASQKERQTYESTDWLTFAGVAFGIGLVEAKRRRDQHLEEARDEDEPGKLKRVNVSRKDYRPGKASIIRTLDNLSRACAVPEIESQDEAEIIAINKTIKVPQHVAACNQP